MAPKEKHVLLSTPLADVNNELFWKKRIIKVLKVMEEAENKTGVIWKTNFIICAMGQWI